MGGRILRLLLVHTRYTQPGGEDLVVGEEAAMLRRHGLELETLFFDNRDLERLPPWRQAAVALWNREAVARVRDAVVRGRPDVVHVHNTFPAASPAVIRAVKARGAPVVMTLHNFRLACVNGLLWRQGQVCEACLGRWPWRAAVHGCWRDSRAKSAVAAGALAVHRFMGTWRQVDAFIALTEFARARAVTMGLPAERLHVKPNFVAEDPGPGDGSGGYALFVGRLSPEKGLDTLLAAWSRIGRRLPLWIAGDGPLRVEVERATETVPGVRWLGRQPHDEVMRLMQEASVLLFPSRCYEGFPRVIVEAFACGLPVVCSRLGSAAELVEHGRTGLHFRPGDPGDLATRIEELLASPERLAAMRRAARAEYEAKYTAERNYEMLMAIYERAIERHRARSRRA